MHVPPRSVKVRRLFFNDVAGRLRPRLFVLQIKSYIHVVLLYLIDHFRESCAEVCAGWIVAAVVVTSHDNGSSMGKSLKGLLQQKPKVAIAAQGGGLQLLL